MTHALRAALLLLAGAALRDCLLLGSAAMLWGVHEQQRLDACPDRARAFLRAVCGGATLAAVGMLLALHTASVIFGWWPVTPSFDAFVSAAIAVIVAMGGLDVQQLTRRHAWALAGMVAVAIARQPWAACAFATGAAGLALFDAVRQLGPLTRTLGAPHGER